MLLEAGLVNKATFFLAPMIIGGQDAPSPWAEMAPKKFLMRGSWKTFRSLNRPAILK
jgi:riboflavin biosynthesis pyrimidine reductase